MPRTTTTPHASTDGAPGQARAASTGQTPAAAADAPKDAPAEKAAGRGRATKATSAPEHAPATRPARADKAEKPHRAEPHRAEPDKAEPDKAEKATRQEKPERAEKATVPRASSRAHKAEASQPKAGTADAAAPASSPTSGYVEDTAFLDQQRQALLAERETYMEQARALRAEAESLVQEMEPGDVQFDDESGEGGTTTVDRERDLALSNQALAAVEEIDAALEKIEHGRYGVCEGCGQLIPQPRLEALPYARLCIACKSGGLSRR